MRFLTHVCGRVLKREMGREESIRAKSGPAQSVDAFHQVNVQLKYSHIQSKVKAELGTGKATIYGLNDSYHNITSW